MYFYTENDAEKNVKIYYFPVVYKMHWGWQIKWFILIFYNPRLYTSYTHVVNYVDKVTNECNDLEWMKQTNLNDMQTYIALNSIPIFLFWYIFFSFLFFWLFFTMKNREKNGIKTTKDEFILK